MRRSNSAKLGLGYCQYAVWLLIISAASAHGSVGLQLREGRPVVDGVFINGNGPYRFLLDTGSNLNLIDTRLARRIGLAATAQVELASAAGKVPVAESDGNEIALDTARAPGQRFLISPLDAIHASSPDVQGVLGNWFLAHFDFLLDLQSHSLTLSPPQAAGDLEGVRIGFHLVNLRPVISTSLGDLVLDSGQVRVVLFGVRPDGDGSEYEMRTVAGAQSVGRAYGRKLIIAGEKVWKGDAIAVSSRPEAGVDGLLPLSLFKMVYICNSAGYIVIR